MELQESMLMSARPHAGLTQLCPATMEASQGTTTHTMDTPAMSVEPGTRTRLLTSHRRLRLVADLARSSRTWSMNTVNAMSTGSSPQPHLWTSLTL